ncbi:putative holliday junction resolvase [Spiroplasma gladiatoris]|uniref:Putative pre-16S rRNA nuclease n=1 Tax=Spiroplasma gladiatoris TaxID=2143 RepID=A0A4P7AIS9_9MOLU|nr:Holliday junction resolvase RuvX [Spiroplasma gladiatoris]QBQ07420.1 putative holliday junction resolvase [Spiroplasma gladiatoris]
MAKYIGLDIGSKTIGVATSEGFLANPYKTIRFEENNFVEAINLLKEILDQEGYEKIIYGYPINMDGSIGHRVEMVELVINLLKEKLNLNDEKLVKVDERLTTRMAKAILIEANMSRKKQKVNKDQLAARLILETFLQNNN